MRNQMKQIEKCCIGTMKIHLKVDEHFNYPKKSTIVLQCSRNQARANLDFIINEYGGKLSQLYWNGKLIVKSDLKVTHRKAA